MVHCGEKGFRENLYRIFGRVTAQLKLRELRQKNAIADVPWISRRQRTNGQRFQETSDEVPRRCTGDQATQNQPQVFLFLGCEAYLCLKLSDSDRFVLADGDVVTSGWGGANPLHKAPVTTATRDEAR